MGCDLGREIGSTEIIKAEALRRGRGHCERSWATRVSAQDAPADVRMLAEMDVACEASAGLAGRATSGGRLPRRAAEASPTSSPTPLLIGARRQQTDCDVKDCPAEDHHQAENRLDERQAEACRADSRQDEDRRPEARQAEDSQPASRQRSRSVPKAAGEAFEGFEESLSYSHLPVVAFSDEVEQMRVWKRGSVRRGEVQLPKRSPDLRIADPIAMSPAYLGFAIDPHEPRVLQYGGVGIVFARPSRGVFMQPSIDTMLLCCGLRRLFSEDGLSFSRAVDVGSGSGFVGKFAAVHAPGSGELNVTLCDIDPAALQYSRSPGFAASKRGFGGRAVSWERHAGDATALLRQEGTRFDLLISNPPYIPTREEVVQGHLSRPSGVAGSKSFWEGVGLVIFLIEHFAERSPPRNAHLVLVITSLTLKAPGVLRALEAADERGVRCRCLLEREVAWKAWYAGPQGNDYLLASGAELRERRRVGRELDVFVGATPPGRSRLQKVADGRQRCRSYHWHVAYVLDLSYA